MQLVVKKASWWEHWDAKQAAVVLPLAAAQIGTLATAGYLYTRLEHLEGLADSLQVPRTTQATPAALNHLPRVHPPLPPPSPPPLTLANTLLPVTLDSAITLSTMQVGQDFSQNTPAVLTLTQRQPPSARASAPHASLIAKPKTVRAEQKTPQKSKVAVKRTDMSMSKKAVPVPVAMEQDKTAQANLADLAVAIPKSTAVTTVTAESNVAPEITPPKRATAPVGVSFWVYAGELRATGWHGPRLHHPIDSGLPEIGRRYRTQAIHGLYDAPHGKREMGGYQRGDVVIVEDVQYEPDNNGAVWVKVTKIHSYGHTNR